MQLAIGKVVVADLPVAAQRGLRIDRAARADAGDTGNADMADQAHAIAQPDTRPDMAEGTDLDCRADDGSVFDDGIGMNGHQPRFSAS
ncbi:hypothetical protein D3C83_108490 [compost metagenome]